MRPAAASVNDHLPGDAAHRDPIQGSGWARWQIPILVGCWFLGFWAPWQSARSGTAWLALASWIALRGLHDLETSSRFVTAALALCASTGALLRIIQAWRDCAGMLLQAGLFLTCAPLCVLQPLSGAVFFLLALTVASVYGWFVMRTYIAADRGPLMQRLLRETFPILSAACFLTMSWQYNAQWMLRGLLVSAGIALVAQAMLPPG